MVASTIANNTAASATVRPIDSVRHPVVGRLADVLRGRSERPKVFIVDDVENIEQATACGISLDSLYATASTIARGNVMLSDEHSTVPFHVLDDAVAGTLFGDQKRSRVFALAHAPRPSRFQDLSNSSGDVVALDGVRLVGNIGAITRTACALGAAGVVLLDSGLRTVLDRRLIRASRALVLATPVVIATREEFADFVQQENLAVAALSAGASEPLQMIRSVKERLVIALGSEREGVSPEVEGLTTHKYAIPMSEIVESLNVSVTAGIALYEHRYGQQ